VELRQSRNHSQEAAARHVKISVRAWNRYETKRADPYLTTREKITKAYGVDPSYLIVEDLSAPLGLGLDSEPPATRADLARLERKVDLLLAHFKIKTRAASGGLPDAPAALANAAPSQTKGRRRTAA
jgi:transcriptional regulator with XRE-family HTH domain